MITSVKLDNFLSHRDTELTFDNGVTVFIGGNGAGKSSIIDAMTFALFGETTRGKNEETIRDGENQAITQIHFDVNGKTYHAIKKTRGKTSSHQLLDGNSSPITITADKTEEEIKKIIGMDYETLGIASIVPQGELSQIIQKTNGRKLRDLIDKVIGTGKYSAAGEGLSEGIAAFREDLREKYDNTDQDVDKIQREINDANQIISKSKPEKEKLEKVAESLKEEIKKYIDRAGGFSAFAETRDVLILYPNGTAIPSTKFFFLGLLLIIIGTGLLKPNVSAIVGGLYSPGDPRRDSGFSIFYMGINLGAMLGPLVCGSLGQHPDYGWHYGFGAAGVGMLFGLIQFWKTKKYLGAIGTKPKS